MDEAAKAYWENPTLVIALSIAVVCLGYSIWWIFKWILNKLLLVVERNTTALEAVLKFISNSDQEVKEVVNNNTKAINELTTEHKVLTAELKRK
jgi:hypothetical protein